MPQQRHKLQAVRELSPSTYVVRFERHGLVFEPGQYLSIGCTQDRDMREYSIYSAKDHTSFEILVKEVPHGSVSQGLRKLESGDPLRLSGPYGFFVLPPAARLGTQPVVLIATGTGISPMRSFVQSYPLLNYTLIHGIRSRQECYEYQHFDPVHTHCCISREPIKSSPGCSSGRVTEYLRDMTLDPSALYYLCGNGNMIYDVYELLKGRGIPAASIKSEVYF